MNTPQRFCSRCGAASEPDGRFCVTCGTPLTVPAPQPSPPPRPVVQARPTPPKKSSHLLLGCLGIAVLLLAGLAASGYWTYGRYLRPWIDEVTEDNGHDQTTTPSVSRELLTKLDEKYDSPESRKARMQALVDAAKRAAKTQPGLALARLREVRELGGSTPIADGLEIERQAEEALVDQAVAANAERQRFVQEIMQTGTAAEMQQQADAALQAALRSGRGP